MRRVPLSVLPKLSIKLQKSTSSHFSGVQPFGDQVSAHKSLSDIMLIVAWTKRITVTARISALRLSSLRTLLIRMGLATSSTNARFKEGDGWCQLSCRNKYGQKQARSRTSEQSASSGSARACRLISKNTPCLLVLQRVATQRRVCKEQ